MSTSRSVFHEYTMRLPTIDDIPAFAEILTDADARELEASNPGTPLPLVVAACVADSRTVTLVERNGKPVALFGLVLPPEGFGRPWLITTRHCNRVDSVLSLRIARGIIEKFRSYVPSGILANAVDSRNRTHVKWLTAMGAEFGISIDVDGVPFLSFTL